MSAQAAAEPAQVQAQQPRVLLVDDDATLRRLVAMMLEEMPIAFVACASVAQARAELQARPVQLLITDWMMPGETGLDLLRWLQAHPQQRAGARLVVFSAGTGDELLAQLKGLDVWRVLAKPVTLQAMEQCVGDALGWGAGSAVSATTVAQVAPAETSAAEAQALRTYFAGNVELFLAFKADCAARLDEDLAAGEAAIAAHDAAALRRLAHNLKGVSRSLGREAAAELGQQLEDACARVDWVLARSLWPQLRQQCRGDQLGQA